MSYFSREWDEELLVLSPDQGKSMFITPALVSNGWKQPRGRKLTQLKILVGPGEVNTMDFPCLVSVSCTFGGVALALFLGLGSGQRNTSKCNLPLGVGLWGLLMSKPRYFPRRCRSGLTHWLRRTDCLSVLRLPNYWNLISFYLEIFKRKPSNPVNEGHFCQ